MKRYLLTIMLVINVLSLLKSQTCLPEGITFSNQNQIDDFQANYPGCTKIEGNVLIAGESITNLSGLNSITEIWGHLQIGNDNVINALLGDLHGLSNLDSLGGHLSVVQCNLLSDLSGLNNLTSVNGYIQIRANNKLESLSGLENVTSEDILLEVDFNNQLVDFTGLEGLTSLDYFSVNHNFSLLNFNGLNNVTKINNGAELYWLTELTSFYGLESVDTIFGDLYVDGNYSLSDISDLSNLSFLGGNISISNTSLESLEGLDNIAPGSIDNLYINNNGNLSDCNVQSICDYLASPNGKVKIHHNKDGCNSPAEIADKCGIVMDCLPQGNYYFTNQLEVDSFSVNFPGCHKLNGNVTIQGDTIISLLGLNQIDTITGDLIIYDNHLLTNLNGLENLNTIGGDLYIGGYDVWPSYQSIGNYSLENVEGLNGLRTLYGYLTIGYNRVLNSLSGLDSVELDYGFAELAIWENENLSECATYSICNFISEGGDTQIGYNNTGCNSIGEVEEACLMGSKEFYEKSVSIFPNPVSHWKSKVHLDIENGLSINKLKVYNQFGEIIINVNDNINEINVSEFSIGMYIIELFFDDYVLIEKLIVL